MNQTLGLISYLVREYDEAITWFTRSLRWVLVEDSPQPDGKRWVVVAPPGPSATAGLLLARAISPEQSAAIGNQAGGRVFLFLETDDFDRDHAAMINRGVQFLEAPRDEVYAKVAVFEDLYGTKWDLLQKK